MDCKYPFLLKTSAICRSRGSCFAYLLSIHLSVCLSFFVCQFFVRLTRLMFSLLRWRFTATMWKSKRYLKCITALSIYILTATVNSLPDFWLFFVKWDDVMIVMLSFVNLSLLVACIKLWNLLVQNQWTRSMEVITQTALLSVSVIIMEIITTPLLILAD